MQAEMSDVLWPHKKPQYRDEELLQQQKKKGIVIAPKVQQTRFSRFGEHSKLHLTPICNGTKLHENPTAGKINHVAHIQQIKHLKINGLEQTTA